MAETKKKVKMNALLLSFKNNQDMMLVVEDGGMATAYFNGDHIVAEYYQSRVPKKFDTLDEFWDFFSNYSKLYGHDYEDKEIIHPSMIEGMLDWLVVSPSTDFAFEITSEIVDDYEIERINKFLFEENHVVDANGVIE